MEKIRAGVIRGKDIRTSTTWAEGLAIHEHGIEESTIENIDPPFTMSHAVKPAGPQATTPSRAHYHSNHARAIYLIKGRMRVFFGHGDDRQVFDVEAGDYIYCPKGQIHSGEVNLNPEEPLEWITVYVGVTSREASERVFVEPPREQEPLAT
jgi:uncharacterized RmlC-like cupin family protein